MTNLVSWGVYGSLVVLLMLVFSWRQQRRERRNLAQLRENMATGLTEPASLHPVIDPMLCQGCGSCVMACPEGDILGLISGRAHLVEPTRCIGHGACAAACPFDAISLVFGTEKRGVDIPRLSADFQTNIPGIYIAGELGGMGLIRNAVTQGTQAMQAMADSLPAHEFPLDVVIVGAGPAGFAASLYAIEHKLRYRTLEQDTVGGTVAHFPRGKVVMTAPVVLPIVGKVRFREVSKEKLIEFWREAQDKTGLQINENERVESITAEGKGFVVRTSQAEYLTARVLLAIGRRGTPRKLDVAGEERSKVVYRLIDPAQYQGQSVLVVGGGDAALEAAASIAEQADSRVTVSYRSAAFSRAKKKNRERIAKLAEQGAVDLRLQTEVREILENQVILQEGGEAVALPNDAVIICAGGVLPTAFLQDIGIEVNTHHGEPAFGAALHEVA